MPYITFFLCYREGAGNNCFLTMFNVWMVFNRNWWWCEEQLRPLLVLLHLSYYLAAELSKGMEDQNNLETVLSINQIYESRVSSIGEKKNSQFRRPNSIFNSLSCCLLLLCAAQGWLTCSGLYVFLLCTLKTKLPLKVQLIFSNNLLGTASNFYLTWHHMVYMLID